MRPQGAPDSEVQSAYLVELLCPLIADSAYSRRGVFCRLQIKILLLIGYSRRSNTLRHMSVDLLSKLIDIDIDYVIKQTLILSAGNHYIQCKIGSFIHPLFHAYTSDVMIDRITLNTVGNRLSK